MHAAADTQRLREMLTPPPRRADPKPHRRERSLQSRTLARAMWDYNAVDSHELSFRAGEDIVVLKPDNSGWCAWRGRS